MVEHGYDEILLQLGLEEGRNIDAAVAAESLLAWIDLARDAARAIDPLADIKVELVAREKGSLKQWLRIVDTHLETISAGADQYPHLKKAAIGLAIAIATSGISAAIEKGFEPDVQKVELSATDRKLLERMTAAIRTSDYAARSAKRFYRVLERDPAVTNVVVRTGPEKTPLVTVDRSEFAFRGGLYSNNEEEAPVERMHRETMSVILLQAPFYSSSKRWRFARDGMPFSARMNDAVFLQAITDGTIPISLREGVRMEVEIEWLERRRKFIGEYVPGSRRIVRVLDPRPSSASLPHFPKKDDEADEDRD